jgi:signal peptidase II
MLSTPIKQDSKEEKILLLYCISITGILLIADQITKAVIEKYLDKTIEVIPGFFSLVKVGNSGAAWGMFAGQRWLLLAISIIFFLGVIFFFRSLTEGWRERYYATALVLSGILGNSIDRIWRGGFVVDFLDFYVKGYHWPAFNVADSAICIGVGIFIISSWKRPVNEVKSEEKSKDKDSE